MIVLHHTACENSVQSIVRYHTSSRRMSEVFYHFIISTNGEIHSGRRIKNVASTLRPTAIEIAIVGRLHLRNIFAFQERALYKLIDNLYQQYNIRTIRGHKDFTPTLCPGNLDVAHYQRYLDNISKEVAKDETNQKEEKGEMTILWQDRIMIEAERRDIIDKDLHRSNEVAEKWFVMALVMRLIDRIEILEGGK